MIRLTKWEPSKAHGGGCIGMATVVLPSGLPGTFAVYLFGRAWAESWPTRRHPKLSRRDMAELNDAAPHVVSLVRAHDPDAFADEGGDLL
jgi:hypothetical protein